MSDKNQHSDFDKAFERLEGAEQTPPSGMREAMFEQLAQNEAMGFDSVMKEAFKNESAIPPAALKAAVLSGAAGAAGAAGSAAASSGAAAKAVVAVKSIASTAWFWAAASIVAVSGVLLGTDVLNGGSDSVQDVPVQEIVAPQEDLPEFDVAVGTEEVTDHTEEIEGSTGEAIVTGIESKVESDLAGSDEGNSVEAGSGMDSKVGTDLANSDKGSGSAIAHAVSDGSASGLGSLISDGESDEAAMLAESNEVKSPLLDGVEVEELKSLPPSFPIKAVDLKLDAPMFTVAGGIEEPNKSKALNWVPSHATLFLNGSYSAFYLDDFEEDLNAFYDDHLEFYTSNAVGLLAGWKLAGPLELWAGVERSSAAWFLDLRDVTFDEIVPITADVGAEVLGIDHLWDSITVANDNDLYDNTDTTKRYDYVESGYVQVVDIPLLLAARKQFGRWSVQGAIGPQLSWKTDWDSELYLVDHNDPDNYIEADDLLDADIFSLDVQMHLGVSYAFQAKREVYLGYGSNFALSDYARGYGKDLYLSSNQAFVGIRQFL